ncbi:MAG: ATP-NAD kinase family protein [Candidatus Bathyarchaeota archaeon]|nr:ATP-NAD kinase family protein [Candidatus Bathyarchaeota archaeon]
MKLGFIVNPIAGMGGKVGLKGTDGVLKEAIARGAKPVAPKRAIEFLQKLKEKFAQTKIEVFTCPGIMGGKEAKAANFSVQILPMKEKKETSAEDTKTAVKLLTAAKVDLIVFVGGDGTAKDIFDAMQDSTAETPVLGVPAGVKMYSGIFAVNPSDAADIVLAFAENQAEITEFEIMDADESAIRSDTFAVKLHGFLKAPFVPMRIQGSKQVSPETADEKENQTAIAKFIIEEMQPNATYILGPGTTVKRIAELLGVEKTVLGVDIYKNGKVMLDVNEKKILEEIEDWQKTWIILSPIGHQGILLGRGNQQISSEIIKRVGKQRIIVAATKSKLRSIDGNVLRVDTGDAEADDMLKGYIKVITDYREWRLMSVQ